MNFENPMETALEGVIRLKNLLRKSGLPLSLSEAGIGNERFEEIADNMTLNGTQKCGAFYPMAKKDILALLERMA